MKLLLDIKDEKATFFMELLKNFPFVKVKKLSSEELKEDRSAEILKGLEDAVEQVNLAKEGKSRLKSARQLLDEL